CEARRKTTRTKLSLYRNILKGLVSKGTAYFDYVEEANSSFLPMSPHSFHSMPLAIIGMACRLPGADDLAQYWSLLIGGTSAVSEIPKVRFDPDLYFDSRKGVRGKSYTRLAGIVHDRPLDPTLCRIPP